jgi:hypothetical protein
MCVFSRIFVCFSCLLVQVWAVYCAINVFRKYQWQQPQL